MITKSKIKREVDKLPYDSLEKLYKYFSTIKEEVKRKNLPSYKLKGQFDNLNIREKTYEQSSN